MYNSKLLKGYNFFPLTFTLPVEFHFFVDAFKMSSDKYWILKPVAKSQGKGIFITNRIALVQPFEAKDSEPYIVQRYLSDPYLIGGKKFDIRVYALVTSYIPLVAYVNRSGFARFTHSRYDQLNISDPQIHLTNVAIQKNATGYQTKIGGKWFLDKLRQFLLSKVGFEKIDLLFGKIQDIVLKTLQCAAKVISSDKRCFQLYGFDILIDSNLTPWLIQVNGSPSMRANTIDDSTMKRGIIDDVLTIIDLEGLLQGKQQQIGGFDVLKKGKKSKIGIFNDRLSNLKMLAKSAALRLNKKLVVSQAHNTKSKAKPLRNSTINNSSKLVNPIKQRIASGISSKPAISMQRTIKNFQIKSKRKKQN